MRARDFMTINPRTISSVNSLKEAIKAFFKFKLSSAPVLDKDNKLCGIVTSDNIWGAINVGLALSHPVTDIMMKNPVTVQPETTLEEVEDIPVRPLPVIYQDKRLAGLITSDDLMNVYYRKACQAESKVTTLVKSALNGVIAINNMGIITEFNEAAVNLTGVSDHIALGNLVETVFPNSGLMQVLNSGTVVRNCEIVFKEKTLACNLSPIFEGGRIAGAVAILKDKSADLDSNMKLATLQHQAEALEIIFESLKQGIIVVDKNNIVTKLNRSYEDVMSVIRDEVLGRPASEIIENSRLHIVLKTGVPELAKFQVHKGRKIICNRVPIFKDGEIIGAIGEAIFKDISEVGALLENGNPSIIQTGQPSAEAKSFIKQGYEAIIGRSRAMIHAKNLAAKAAAIESNVLIIGESGTGKELFSQVIHSNSKYYSGPAVTISCTCPSEELEAELFGSEEGGLQGFRDGRKRGKLELACGGTVFFDEIGDIPLTLQAKLFHAIQAQKNKRGVDSSLSMEGDVRIIAATNKDLAKMVQNRTFREDLYYMVNVICIKIPPLRNRREDIGELIEVLSPQIYKRLGIPEKRFSPEAMELLREYDWPGNVRELINVLEQLAAIVSSPVIIPKHLVSLNIAISGSQADAQKTAVRGQDKDMSTQSEHEKIIEALRCANGNKLLAARMLGMHRSTLYEKLKKYNMQK